MEFSIKFDTVKSGWSIYILRGVGGLQVIVFKKYYISFFFVSPLFAKVSFYGFPVFKVLNLQGISL